jgi:hypothetical protein
MNKRIIRVSDAIPDMPASFDAAVERTLQTVCKKRQSAPLRAVETVTETETKTKLTRWERAKKIMVASVAAVFAVLSLGIGAIVISRGLQNKQYEAAQPGNRVSETSSEQSSATDAITEHTYRIELCPSFDENTEPVSPEPAQENKISEKLRTALETTTEESLDLYVWFKDDSMEEAVQEKMQRTDPELYELYRKKLNNEPMTDAETDRVIEGARAVYTEVYQSMNRDRLNANLTDGQILYLGAYGPMCIVSVPTVMVEGLAESGDVVYLDLFENMTSTSSAEGDGVGLSAIRMSITELDVNPGTLQWTTELRLKKNGEAENPLKALTRVAHGEARCKFYNADGLLTEDAGAKLVELVSKDNNYVATEDEADWIVRISSVAAMPQVYDSFPAALPPTGEITVEQTFFLVDAAADGLGLPVLLSRVHQSFTFDAEKLLNVKEPTHIDVPLSGEIILTVRTGTGYRNERAALDGATLDAEIHYTKTGVFVIVSIKDPGSLTEAQRDALLQAMNNPWNVNDCALACVDANGDQRMVYHLSRAFWGTTKLARFEALVLPVEYASAQTLEFRLCAFFVTGEAGGERNEDWRWDVKDGALPELLTEWQSLGTFMLPLTEAAQTAGTDTPVKAIRYHGMIYVTTGREAAGEVAESAIRRTTDSPVPLSQLPTEEGQTNFGETSYAMTIDGLAVLVGSEWTLFEPLLPDTDKGVFEAAYAQVLLEQYEFDRTYDARRAKMETMSEEEAQDYDTIMEGEENFLHQRFVRLQRIYEVTASVEQEVDRMRLSEIAYLDGRLYFAFAASKVWAFDVEPEIRINGTQYHAIDESGFFALKETETEQYAFYEIEPGTLSGTVQITVKNNDHAFCFTYNVEDRTVALSQDDVSPQSDVSYYFLVDGVPVYPYEGFLWESKPELEADGIGVQLEDEEVRNRIPVTEYNVGMPLVVLTADGWKLDEIIVYDAAYERIVDVAGSKIPWKEGYGYVTTDLLQTLSPGTYYVSAIVSYRADNYSIGNEIAICLKIGAETSEASIPAMFVSGGQTVEPYVLKSDRVDPKRLGSIDAMPIVALYDDFSIDSPTGIKYIDVYDTEGELVMRDLPDVLRLKTLSEGYYRLVVIVTGTDKTDYACICTLKVSNTPCRFLVNRNPVYPYENFLWEDKDGLAADGMSIFYTLKDERIRGEIPYSMLWDNTSFEIVPRDGWELDRVMIYTINGDTTTQIARIERGELTETEHGYTVPQMLKTLGPGTYYLSAVVLHCEGNNSRGYECVICLQIGE